MKPPWLQPFLRRAWYAVAAFVALFLVVRPDRMLVEHVVYVGNVRATTSQLRHLSDMPNGTRMWEVEPSDVAERVEAHPWVKNASAWIRWPGTLIVEVDEHSPVALVAWRDDLYYVDSEGVPFLRAHADDLNHPMILGLSDQLDEAHPDLPWLVLHDALWLITELDARRLIPRDQISEVSFLPSRGYTVQTTGASRGNPTARVLFAPGDYERQLTQLQHLLHNGVDLSAPLHVDVAPERVVIVRPLNSMVASAAPPSTQAIP
jgi:hypothetical protein